MTRLAIAEVMRAIGFPEDGAFAVLRACVDASWNDQPPSVMAAAGYVATLDEWKTVEDAWDAALKDWNISYFHLCELRNMVGDPDLCELYFTNIITDSKIAPIGAALLTGDWKRPDWGDDRTARLSSPYEQCLDLTFKVIGDYTNEIHPGRKVAILCCLDSTEDIIVSAFKRSAQRYRQFDDIAIKSGKNQIVMQCADLGAGVLRRSWRAIAAADPAADDLPWGEMPKGKGVKGRTAFWSLRQGAVITRALEIYDRKLGGLKWS
jgi:hypothetical protein